MFRFYFPTNDLYSIAFSPNHQYFATASADKTARIWEVSHGKQITCMRHEGYVYFVAFSPDSKYLATASADKTTRIWEVPTGREISRLTNNDIKTVVFSADGKYLAICLERYPPIKLKLVLLGQFAYLNPLESTVCPLDLPLSSKLLPYTGRGEFAIASSSKVN